jgi:hypothetical protein
VTITYGGVHLSLGQIGFVRPLLAFTSPSPRPLPDGEGEISLGTKHERSLQAILSPPHGGLHMEEERTCLVLDCKSWLSSW